MNATSLYIATCRYVIRSNPYDPESWADLYRYLPYLRQALTCYVCGKILDKPMAPKETICQHHVCCECVGGKMKLRPSCSWCKDYAQFVENVQLGIIVQCFKKLCEYLESSSIAVSLANMSNGGTNTLMTVIHEGLAIKDCNIPIANLPINIFPPVLKQVKKTTFEKVKKQKHLAGRRRFLFNVKSKTKCSDSEQNKDSNICKRLFSDTNSKETNLKMRQKKDNLNPDLNKVAQTGANKRLSETVAAEHDYNRGLPQEGSHKGRSKHLENDHGSLVKKVKDERQDTFNANKNESTHHKISRSKKDKAYGCRCGLATPRPGQLTCCGQRCPCYSSFRGCINCRCRGCRNPRGDPKRVHPYLRQTNIGDNEKDNSDIEIDI